VIDPEGLVDHARRLTGSGLGGPGDVDLRRGVSAAYYAVFHELTAQAAAHLVGSADLDAKLAIRRTWTHGELKAAADLVVDRARVLRGNPNATMPKSLMEFGPLPDLAASDVFLVAALRQFSELQELRHSADYDHAAVFDKAALLTACQRASAARSSLRLAAPKAREALFTLITVRRKDFRERV